MNEFIRDVRLIRHIPLRLFVEPEELVVASVVLRRIPAVFGFDWRGKVLLDAFKLAGDRLPACGELALVVFDLLFVGVGFGQAAIECRHELAVVVEARHVVARRSEGGEDASGLTLELLLGRLLGLLEAGLRSGSLPILTDGRAAGLGE